ncbi:MAG: phosphate acyltransferase PlsX [Caldilineaceae bacterium]|nr:phosphate acyltransferase PlsX [Caldilineaceae bacterium]
MNIALDAMGGDHAPREIVAGAVEAAREYGVVISLVGRPAAIEAELAKHDTAGLGLEIVPAAEVIEMDDKPARAVRNKPDSSMVIACNMVRDGRAQAFITAGNTGGALTAGILKVGRIKGVMRPALVTPFPTRKGFCVILDVGANADTRPEHMQQFGIMGSIYAERVFDVQNPGVYVLSNGEEAGKGNQLILSAYEALEQTPCINFCGNVESKEIMAGKADVVVTDGFTGNIFLKTSEALAGLVQSVMYEEFKRDPLSMAGALLARGGLRRVRRRMDDSQYGGAVLLGLRGPVIVAHGRSNATAIRHTVRVAKTAIEHDLTHRIEEAVLLSEGEPLSELIPEPVIRSE